MNVNEFISQISSIEFWQGWLSGLESLGFVFPILLAALESLIPPLPLVGIVSLNVVTYGPIAGFVTSWLGTIVGCTAMYFFWRFIYKEFAKHSKKAHSKIEKAKNWVDGVHVPELFLIAMMPFTPSFFLNFAFGLAEYPPKKYLPVLYTAKFIMIGSLALLGEGLVAALSKPWIIIFVIIAFFGLYYLSKKVSEKHNLSDK
ncbi:MAG: VTT domain-containing protein [Pseudobutyrivibrio sp.]|nr:VTT domain-containing protein [Pseudobutyrivibrio sp.]